jgi:hypothetical protein
LANQALQNMLRDICFVGARNFFKIADKSTKRLPPAERHVVSFFCAVPFGL